jgi:DNA-binding CsgD family transcriptional regulator
MRPASAAVPSLTRWGLSSDADLVYRLLHTYGSRSASDASRELGMPAPRIADALEELRVAAAVRAVAGRVGRVWAAGPPAEVLAQLRRRRLVIADPAAQALSHLRVVAGLPLSALSQAPGGQLRRLRSREHARERIAALVAVEQQEHLAMNPEQSFSADATAAALPLDRTLLTRGVKFRSIGLPPPDGDRLFAFGAEALRLGARYREAAEVPLKLLVFDRRVALIPVDPADLGRGAIEISAPGVVEALVRLFDARWATAADPARTGVPRIELTGRERALVSLLAEGHTDVSAAAALRISPRSVAYALRALMDKLGVDNRFQLGIALGALDIVSPPGHTPSPER